jgi:hypothetical protein
MEYVVLIVALLLLAAFAVVLLGRAKEDARALLTGDEPDDLSTSS